MYKTTGQVNFYKIPGKKKNAEGIAFFRICVRKIMLENAGEINPFYPAEMAITAVKRNGETTYSIKGLFEPARPRFGLNTLCLDSRNAPQAAWKVMERGMPKPKMQAFLAGYIGQANADKVIRETF